MPGALAIVGETREEAQEKWADLDTRINLKSALANLQFNLKHIDLSSHDLDAPFPEIPPEHNISRAQHLVDAAKNEGLTLRQVLIRSAATNAHFPVIGTVKDVVDELQHWFEDGACDGFNFLPAVMPVTLDGVLTKLVPEMQRRGLCRTEYEGKTLRENFGVPAAPVPLRT